MKQAGMTTKDSMNQVSRQALFSLSLIAVSIGAQCILGKAGAYVSVGIGVALVIYSIIDISHKRQFVEELQVYTIEKCKPIFI